MIPSTPPRGACPICGRPSAAEYRPFCTKRCADVDLSRWLGGAYRITVDDPEGDPDDAEAPPPAPPEKG